MEIFPQLFMLPQVNDGCRLLAAFIHYESDSAHENNLAEKCPEANSKRITGQAFFWKPAMIFSAARIFVQLFRVA
jgi:hypothetical protein